MKYPIHKWTKTIERSASKEIATREVASAGKVLGALPNPDPVLKKTGKRLETYRDLTADWEVFAAIELIHSGLQSLEWELQQQKADQAAYEDLKLRMTQWDIDSILGECVNARNFGYQPFEYLWEKDEQWKIESIVGKPPEWFNFGKSNNLQLITKNNRKGEPVQPYQFGVARNRPSYNNPYGEAILSRVFWPVTFKKGGIEFWIKFLEKYGMPWVVGKQPRGAGEAAKDSLLDELVNMVQDAVAVIPDDASVDLKESPFKASSSGSYSGLVNHCDAAIDKVILSSETVMSVSKSGGDQRHNSSESAKVSKSVIMAIGRMAESVINNAIQWEWHFNYDSPPPVFSIFEPKDIQKGLAERDEILSRGSNVRFKKEYFINNYGLPEDEFEIAEPENDQPGFSQHPQGCQCQGCRAPSSFAEDAGKSEAARNQRILEEMIEGIGGEDAAATNQQLMEKVLEPVMEMINNADSMEDIMQHLSEQFPEMNTEQLEQRLTSVLFLADTWGRLTAADEEAIED